MMNNAHGNKSLNFSTVGVAVLAVSDSRSLEEDTSGAWLTMRLKEVGHRVIDRQIVQDETSAIQNIINRWVHVDGIECILVTGGTGMSPRDVTPEALEPLFEKKMSGFGELFRQLSFSEIGTATLQSRATAGLISGRPIFVLPGSRGACRLALNEIILPQLDARTKPCSFPALWATWGRPGET